MSNPNVTPSSVLVQHCLDRLQAGDEQAREELLAVSIERLRRLARVMIRDQAGVRVWEETDDVLQNATLRLWKSLRSIHPETPLDYFRLAAQLIRRELIDLARHYFGPEGMAQHQAERLTALSHSPSAAGPDMRDLGPPAAELAGWTEFHAQVERLGTDERQVFDLLWYQGLNQNEAAKLLAVSERTVQRRWQEARLILYRAMEGESPPVD